MKAVRFDGKEATLGLDQGYQPLPVRYIQLESGHDAVQSMWQPDAEELAALNAGAYVVVTVLGSKQPPLALTTWNPTA